MAKGCTYVSNINTSDTDTTVVLDGRDHLVQNFRSVCLKTSSQLDGVRPTLWVLSSDTLERDIRATMDHFLQLIAYRLDLGKVESLTLGVHLLAVVETPVLVDDNDTTRAIHECKVNAHLTDGASTPDGDHITLLDASVDNTVPARANDVRKVQTFLIGNIVGKLEEVDIAAWDTDVLGLTTSESTGEMAVAEHTSGVAAVHARLDLVRVGLFALR